MMESLALAAANDSGINVKGFTANLAGWFVPFALSWFFDNVKSHSKIIVHPCEGMRAVLWHNTGAKEENPKADEVRNANRI